MRPDDVEIVLGEFRIGNVDHRTFSTFGPDFLAGYLLLTLPLTLSAFAAATTSSMRLPLALGLALQSSCLFLTGSRAGTGIALVAVFGWAALTMLTRLDRNRMRWIAVGIAIFVFASVLSAAPTLGRYNIGKKPEIAAQPILARAGPAKQVEDNQAHSWAFRKSTWVGTVRMARRNPLFGTGIGSFTVAYTRYADTTFTRHAHNSFLQWTAETGFPALLHFLRYSGPPAPTYCIS